MFDEGILDNSAEKKNLKGSAWVLTIEDKKASGGNYDSKSLPISVGSSLLTFLKK